MQFQLIYKETWIFLTFLFIELDFIKQLQLKWLFHLGPFTIILFGWKITKPVFCSSLDRWKIDNWYGVTFWFRIILLYIQISLISPCTCLTKADHFFTFHAFRRSFWIYFCTCIIYHFQHKTWNPAKREI